MNKVSEILASLEKNLSPTSQLIIFVLLLVAGLYYASDIGVSVGKALYYLTH